MLRFFGNLGNLLGSSAFGAPTSADPVVKVVSATVGVVGMPAPTVAHSNQKCSS